MTAKVSRAHSFLKGIILSTKQNELDPASMLGLRDSQTRNIPPRSFVTGVHSRQNFGILASEILPAKQTCLDKKDRGLPVQDMIDHRSYAHNLSSCKIKAWKKKKRSALNGIGTHDLCDTGAGSYQLSYQAIWESFERV